MKTLFFLRHAKSSWKDETLADIERPLNGRGRKAAKTVGAFLRQEGIVVDLVLSSSAVRTRETIELVIKASGFGTEVRFDERIYEADARRLLSVVKQIEPTKKSVLLAGHNPGLEEFLKLLTGENQTMPTGALSKVVLTASTWDGIKGRDGSLEWIVKPKQLQKG
jgi:phosphohistidine phosphatase